MNSKRMLNADVMVFDGVSKLSDKSFRLYLYLMLFSNDDGVCSSLETAKKISEGAEDSDLKRIEEVGLISRLDDKSVLSVSVLVSGQIGKMFFYFESDRIVCHSIYLLTSRQTA